MDKEQVQAQIRRYVIKAIYGNDLPFDFTDDSPIITDGRLEPLELVNLTMKLEEKYKIEILSDEVTEENFETVSLLTDFIVEKIQNR